MCNSVGNGSNEGVVTSILKHEKVHHSKTHLKIFVLRGVSMQKWTNQKTTFLTISLEITHTQ